MSDNEKTLTSDINLVGDFEILLIFLAVWLLPVMVKPLYINIALWWETRSLMAMINKNNNDLKKCRRIVDGWKEQGLL